MKKTNTGISLEESKNIPSSLFGAKEYFLSYGIDYGIFFRKKNLKVISDTGIYCLDLNEIHYSNGVAKRTYRIFYGKVLSIKGGIILHKEAYKEDGIEYMGDDKLDPLLVEHFKKYPKWGMPKDKNILNFETLFFLDHENILHAKVVESRPFGASNRLFGMMIYDWRKYFFDDEEVCACSGILRGIGIENIIDHFIKNKILVPEKIKERYEKLISLKQDIIKELRRLEETPLEGQVISDYKQIR